ncbi:hypothetical protein Syun_000169 [Stephania yunnanensis]|uniref:Phagocyte signaling-impaired protein n=1 Tax=Stephania yunnanensis TaxID=152371 RepID=A0AAP0LFF8_9MAGN
MASKFGMAGGIPERRVRPIWDAVDTRQFKSALKLSTALLSKYPTNPYAIALKALILERMGKPDEALAVCLEAKDRLFSENVSHIDDLTLSTLQIVFQRLDRLDMATCCYEYACGKFPNNLDLMIGLFNCYVREYSFVKQQQTAIKMYKVIGEERFLLWAVCSIQLQVLCGNGDEKLLLLAEGLLKKHTASHSLHEPEGLLVYISILEQQAKYGDALQILSGKLGSLIVIEVDKQRLQGRLLARACDFAAAAEVFEKVLESRPDDWECFLDYLGCLLEDGKRWRGKKNFNHPANYEDSKSRLSDEVFNSRMSKASIFIEKLQAKAIDSFVRCPYLASLEIEKRKRLYLKAQGDKLRDALSDYFCRFGHLACFTNDVEMFVQVLTEDEKKELIEKLNASCESSSTMTTKQLGQLISIFKIQELFGILFTLSIGELETTARNMVKIFCENLPLSRDLDPQENMYGEDLLCLACNVLVQLFWRTRHLGYLLEAIMILEFGLTIRRYNGQFKILLSHLYSHLNSLPLAYEWYKTLEIKNILLETVSHHILPQLLTSPLWCDLSDLLKGYIKFMDDHFKESADLTFLSYRHRNYSKVIEFVQFKEKLEHSHQYLRAMLEAHILQLKQKADSIEEEELVLESLCSGIPLLEFSSEVRLNSLSFNEDTQTRPWWTPTPDDNFLLGSFEGDPSILGDNLFLCQQNQALKMKANARKLIERRSLLPRLIFLSIQSASSLLKENLEVNGSTSDDKNCSELRSLLEKYAGSLGLSFSAAVEEVVGVANGEKTLEARLFLNIVDWMNFTVFLNSWSMSSHEDGLVNVDGKKHHLWHTTDSIIEKSVADKLQYMEPLIKSAGGNLSILIEMITEPLAWHTLIIQSCLRSSLPASKKKKKGGPQDQFTLPISQSIQCSIESLGRTIEAVTEWLREQIDTTEDQCVDVLVALLHKEGCNEGPGQVLYALEALLSCCREQEHNDRISQALRSWNSANVLRNLVTSQKRILSEFHSICESKIKLLQKVKQQI